ncbi:MAG: 50S ribosomal protein L18 [Candidatus Aenigmarchaeota archaeon]|nr:50S ribosomal protein L18 [Candidatus Aenigmarchaeota archaeon]
MATKTTYTVKYQRALQGKTDYKLRLRLLLSGATRCVIRRSLKNIIIQFVNYKPQGDEVIVSADSRMLAKYGWRGAGSNTSAAYLTGLLAAKRALPKVKNCISDIGSASTVHGSVVFAALAGVLEGGLAIPATKSVFPKEERLLGKHTAAYAKQLKEKNLQRYNKQFAQYLKNGLSPENLPEHVQTVKAKILGEKHA